MIQPPRAARHAVAQLPPEEGQEAYVGGMSYSVLHRGLSNRALRADLKTARREHRHERNKRRSSRVQAVVLQRRHRDAIRTLRREAAERRAAAASPLTVTTAIALYDGPEAAA